MIRMKWKSDLEKNKLLTNNLKKKFPDSYFSLTTDFQIGRHEKIKPN